MDSAPVSYKHSNILAEVQCVVNMVKNWANPSQL